MARRKGVLGEELWGPWVHAKRLNPTRMEVDWEEGLMLADRSRCKSSLERPRRPGLMRRSRSLATWLFSTATDPR